MKISPVSQTLCPMEEILCAHLRRRMLWLDCCCMEDVEGGIISPILYLAQVLPPSISLGLSTLRSHSQQDIHVDGWMVASISIPAEA